MKLKPLGRSAMLAGLVSVWTGLAGLGQPLSAWQDAPVTVGAPAEVIVRAVPAAVVPPPPYRTSIERGWRAPDGSPSSSYWSQWSKYDLEARLDPETGTLDGSVRIRYANNAPATLGSVWIHLHQNLHKQGVPRSSTEEVTGGVTLRNVVAAGDTLSEGELGAGPAYRIQGTLMELRPPEPLERGDTLELVIDWSVVLPQAGAGRMGYSEREVYMVGYWFPKMAVFEALRGWDAQPYLGNAEFHDGFGDYTAALTVPTGWSVMATGTLENPEEVYSALTARASRGGGDLGRAGHRRGPRRAGCRDRDDRGRRRLAHLPVRGRQRARLRLDDLERPALGCDLRGRSGPRRRRGGGPSPDPLLLAGGSRTAVGEPVALREAVDRVPLALHGHRVSLVPHDLGGRRRHHRRGHGVSRCSR